jgi:ABC-type glycerol-3-phosphate transport system permease component
VDLVLSDEGQRVLEKYNFEPVGRSRKGDDQVDWAGGHAHVRPRRERAGPAREFIGLPLLSLVIWSVNEGSWRTMASPVALDALLLSAKTTAVTMAFILVVGTPAAFDLARTEFPGKRLVNTLVDLPAVLPPAQRA